MKRSRLVGLLAGTFLVLSTAHALAPAVIDDETSSNPSPTSSVDPSWAALDKSTWIVEGNPRARHIVYVFTDTECKYCRKLWQAMQPFLKTGQLQTRHVMVAVIAEDSAGRGAAMLDAAHPAAALKANEDSREPRLAPESPIPRATLTKLAHNETLMHTLGAQGTPAIVYLDHDGNVKMAQGVPPPDVMAQIFGNAAAH
ncbi:thiol:disulfide interchange protein DsbG [Rhodanobacter sp. BL-MT-08]